MAILVSTFINVWHILIVFSDFVFIVSSVIFFFHLEVSLGLKKDRSKQTSTWRNVLKHCTILCVLLSSLTSTKLTTSSRRVKSAECRGRPQCQVQFLVSFSTEKESYFTEEVPLSLVHNCKIFMLGISHTLVAQPPPPHPQSHDYFPWGMANGNQHLFKWYNSRSCLVTPHQREQRGEWEMF